MLYPFCPLPASTQAVTLGPTATTIQLDVRSKSAWVDNRGTTDVLVQFGASPTIADGTAFRVPAGCSQPLQVPVYAQYQLQLKRVAGATAELVYVTSGSGF